MKLLSPAQRLIIFLIRLFGLTSLEDELGGHMHKVEKDKTFGYNIDSRDRSSGSRNK